MLRQRVITAVLLLLVLLPALFYPSAEPFCAVALLLIAAAAWELARLLAYPQWLSLLTGLVCAGLCLYGWWLGLLRQPLPQLWLLAGAFWVLAGSWLLRGGAAQWLRLPRALRLLAGVAVLCLAWLAVAQARVVGINFLLSALVLVWAADIAAYFAGRRFGGKFARTRLAPSISPGKSWEGVWGAMAGVLLLALAWRWADVAWAAQVPSLYSHLFHKGWALLVLAVLFMVAMSVVGDLVESLIKRAAQVKDSSNLLPGHGGVLDRVDALLPTLPLAMMLYSL